MAYTPINWDEVTPINPANLNKMDGEIDSNESRVDGNENKLDDIDSNGDGIVDRADNADNADNADRLNGKRWVTIASGSKNDDELFIVSLKPGGSHHHYNISVFNNEHGVTHGADFTLIHEPSSYDDKLFVQDSISGGTTYYEVWSWE